MTLEQSIEAAVERALRRVLSEKTKDAERWRGCISLAEAGKLASVSVSTVEKWGAQGLEILRKGRVRRVDVDKFRRFLETRDDAPPVDAKEWAQQMLAASTRKGR